jgi:hypothetical protein
MPVSIGLLKVSAAVAGMVDSAMAVASAVASRFIVVLIGLLLQVCFMMQS